MAKLIEDTRSEVYHKVLAAQGYRQHAAGANIIYMHHTGQHTVHIHPGNQGYTAMTIHAQAGHQVMDQGKTPFELASHLRRMHGPLREE